MQWRKTDWAEFLPVVQDGWLEGELEARVRGATSQQEVDALVTDITDLFQKAASASVPSSTSTAYSRRWWTKELTNMHHEVKRLQNRAGKRNASQQERDTAKAAMKNYHRELRAQQRRHWRMFLNEADERTVWQASRYVTQALEDALASRLPALNLPDGSMAQTCFEKRDALMAQFFPTPPPADLSDIANTTYPPQIAHTPFTHEEVIKAIENLSPFKAPGPSGIPNAALRESADIISPTFTELANTCIRLHYHPKDWKKFTSITLRKPGKPSYLVPKAYRPITLEDTSGKVMESVVASRLAAIMEQQGLLPPNHFGGRAGRTTTDAVLYLTQRVKDAWRKGQVATLLFLDITSAFPSVNHARLLHNLRKRGVPEDLVLWVENFLQDRRTQLKFDDFTSEPLCASTGLPQGSPLSPILYLFYSADLLEIIDMKDKARGSLGFIDDTNIIAISDSFEQNIAILTALVPKLLGWSDRHACWFDVPKFQMVHCTHNEKKYKPLSLTIGPHIIEPTDSARYLGIIIDRRLRWREHVDSAVAKGTAAVLAVARLSRPTFGLPHKHIRSLVQSVVFPKMEYGLTVWYTPVRHVEGGSRRKGSVGLARRLGKVQRLASRIICGAFKTTATDFLDYHAHLPPVDLRLNHTAFDSAARLTTLPSSHPLHNMVARCSRHYPRLHRSPLHELLWSFQELRGVETVDPGLVDPTWTCPFETVVLPDKGSAAAHAEKLVSEGQFCVFTDGSGFQGGIGTAAIADGQEHRHVQCTHLGPDTEHTVFEGELGGLVLALDIIEAEPRITRANILLDNKPAIRAAAARRPRPGQQIIELFHRRLARLKRKRRTLTIRLIWVPGHRGVEGNEDADTEVKDATTGDSTDLPLALQGFLGLPKSVSALKATAKERVAAAWAGRWASSKHGHRIWRNFNPAPPGKHILKLYNNLPRRQASVISQLRSGHVSLNQFLSRINAVSSPMCPRCSVPEMVEHFLLSCRRYCGQCDALRQAVQDPLTLRSVLGGAKRRAALLEYVEATGRLDAYREQTS